MSFWTEDDVLQYLHTYNVPYASVYGDIVPCGGGGRRLESDVPDVYFVLLEHILRRPQTVSSVWNKRTQSCGITVWDRGKITVSVCERYWSILGYRVIERSVFIKFISKILSSCVIASLLVFPAQAASSEEIQQQIDSAIEKQNMAHQIAEYVRSFGESEDNPAILFAQEKWWEQQRILTNLYQQYDQAVQDENNKGKYIGGTAENFV